MLIIAIPKSASTSLMSTLQKLHNLKAQQVFFSNYPPPENTALIHKYHSDIREITPAKAKELTDITQIFKQHIPPSQNNIHLLRQEKKVILLRPTEEIIEAYFRAQSRKIHEPRPEFHGCKTLKDWISRANETGLTKDLNWFNEAWSNESKLFPETNLVINYSDITKSPKKIINRIESFYKMPLSKYVSLDKARYSRHPPMIAPIQILFNKTLMFYRKTKSSINKRKLD